MWPHGAPTLPRAFRSQKPEKYANAANSWIPADGRSRTRTWDLFLIRNTFCRLQSSQLALNPCKRVQQHVRKATGDDWALQAGGPIVAPRPQFEGRASYVAEANITPTIRSSPDAAEECRLEPAGSRPPWRASSGGARPSQAVGVQNGVAMARVRSTPGVAMRPQQRRLPSYLDLGGLPSNRRRGE